MTGSASIPTLRIGGLFVILTLLTFGPSAEATLTAWCGDTNGGYQLGNCDFDPNGKHGYSTL
ncbi:MAG: hypothetical protein ACE1ZA_10915, partial [Pseudomonadales bacterium]